MDDDYHVLIYYHHQQLYKSRETVRGERERQREVITYCFMTAYLHAYNNTYHTLSNNEQLTKDRTVWT